jgi:Lon-like ATP-dependent protease
VKDLGDRKLPEVEGAEEDTATAAAAAAQSAPVGPPQAAEDRSEATIEQPPSGETTPTAAGGAEPKSPTATGGEASSVPTSASAEGKQQPHTTTKVRKPLVVPADVSVRITKENLVDYVGPPVYQKDRMYTKTSPAGVSCGLGYLGNGSGSVMPIEATVS